MINEEDERRALEAAREWLHRPFADKEDPQPAIDGGLVHRFMETINRSTTAYKTEGKKPFALDEVPLCVLGQFGQGVWGPFRPQLKGYGGYLFGQVDTKFCSNLALGEELRTIRYVEAVDAVHGRKVKSMIRFKVAVEMAARDGRPVAKSTLTLMRLSAHQKEAEVTVK